MPKMQKILYVVNNADFLISHRLPLLKAAHEQGYAVHVACPATSTIQKLKEEGVTHHAWRLSRKSINPVNEMRTIRNLYQIYQQVKPDLAHHLTIKPIIYGAIAARWAHTPAVINAVCGMGSTYISNSVKYRVLRQLTNQGFSFAGKQNRSRFIFQNQDDQDYFIKNKITQNEKTIIIPGSGVCMQDFQPLPMPDRKPYIIVLASRLLREKGVVEFVEAARSLQTEKIARFVLVGDIDSGNPSTLSHAQINAWVKSGIVEWWGFKTDIREVFRESHIICLPSYREGMPRVLIEAAACARPIITTHTTGCKELVCEGENGYLVPIKNAQALAEAFKKILQKKPNDLWNLGLASRRLVEEKFSLEKVIAETMAVYQELLKSTDGR